MGKLHLLPSHACLSVCLSLQDLLLSACLQQSHIVCGAMQEVELEACSDAGGPAAALHEDERTHDSGTEPSEVANLLDSPAAAVAAHPATQEAATCLDVDDAPHIACLLSDLRQRMRKRRKLEPCADSISTFEQQHAFAAASLQVKLLVINLS